MKIILVVVVSINLLFSFYNWGVYAYNAKESYSNIEGLEELYNKAGDISKLEKNELIIKAKTTQISWEVSKNEWLLKLLIDLVILVIVLFYCYSKSFNGTKN